MLELSFQQQNIWNLRKFYPNTSITNICCSIFFHEEINQEKLIEAMQMVIKSQGGLRLHFHEINGILMQEEKSYIPLQIPVRFFQTLDAFHKYASKLALAPFMLDEEYLFKLEIIQIGKKTGILFCIDHLIADAWTVNLLIKLTYQTYLGIINKHEYALENSSFLTSVLLEKEYQQSLRYQKDQSFWENKYIESPKHHPISSYMQHVTNPKANRYSIELEDGLVDKILEYESQHNTSPAVLFEGALGIYLNAIYHDQNQFTIGFITLNRSNSQLKNTAGMCVSTLPLTFTCSNSQNIQDFLDHLKTTHFSIFRHQKYPYSEISNYIQNKHHLSYPLYDVIVSYQNATTDVPADSYWYSNGYCEVPLEIHIRKKVYH